MYSWFLNITVEKVRNRDGTERDLQTTHMSLLDMCLLLFVKKCFFPIWDLHLLGYFPGGLFYLLYLMF